VTRRVRVPVCPVPSLEWQVSASCTGTTLIPKANAAFAAPATALGAVLWLPWGMIPWIIASSRKSVRAVQRGYVMGLVGACCIPLRRSALLSHAMERPCIRPTTVTGMGSAWIPVLWVVTRTCVPARCADRVVLEMGSAWGHTTALLRFAQRERQTAKSVRQATNVCLHCALTGSAVIAPVRVPAVPATWLGRWGRARTTRTTRIPNPSAGHARPATDLEPVAMSPMVQIPSITVLSRTPVRAVEMANAMARVPAGCGTPPRCVRYRVAVGQPRRQPNIAMEREPV